MVAKATAIHMVITGRKEKPADAAGKCPSWRAKSVQGGHAMAGLTWRGKSFEVDEDGFLLRFDDWCPEWMEYVKESGRHFRKYSDHQKILDFLQDYYKKNGVSRPWCVFFPRTPATS